MNNIKVRTKLIIVMLIALVALSGVVVSETKIYLKRIGKAS